MGFKTERAMKSSLSECYILSGEENWITACFFFQVDFYVIGGGGEGLHCFFFKFYFTGVMPKLQPNLPFISHKNACLRAINALALEKVSQSVPEGMEIC